MHLTRLTIRKLISRQITLASNVGIRLASTRSSGRTMGRRKMDMNEIKAKRTAYDGELKDFRELLTLPNQQSRKGAEFLQDITNAMTIYDRLKLANTFAPAEIALLIQGIHNSSRVNYRAHVDVISVARNVRHQQIMNQLLSYLDIVATDLKNGVVQSNAFGIMQLMTAFSSMRKTKEGLQLWQSIIAEENKETIPQGLREMAWMPKVVGAVIDLMIGEAKPIQEIEQVYKSCLEAKPSNTLIVGSNINLEHSLCRAYIYYDHVTEALKHFGSMLQKFPNDDYHLSRVHETFIGDCTDLEVAKTFFDEAVERKTPYVMTCHPSAVHRLMERLWAKNQNLDEVFEIWQKYIAFVPVGSKERLFNILTYSLLDCFFVKYPKVNTEAYEFLKKIISTYSDLRGQMSPLFLNTLLTNVSNWKDANVTLGIVDVFKTYNLPDRVDTIRVVLNAFQDLESLEITDELIESYWLRRLALIPVGSSHSSPSYRNEVSEMQIFDFAALAKACSIAERHNLFKKIWYQFMESDKGGFEDGEWESFCEALRKYFTLSDPVNLSYASIIIEQSANVQPHHVQHRSKAEPAQPVEETEVSENVEGDLHKAIPVEEVPVEEDPIQDQFSTDSDKAPAGSSTK